MEPNNPDIPIAGAIAYPGQGAESSNVVRAPIQPRQPQNLQGLLRFAMEARQEDPPAQVDLAPMDNQRREFLEQALQRMVMNVVEILRLNIAVLVDPEKIETLLDNDELTMDVQNAFDNLGEVIEDIDTANDFCKVGGFEVFDVCYGTRNCALWVQTNNLLAGVCQNNPYAQQIALDRGIIPRILELLNDPETKRKEKFVYALSCSVREFEPGCKSLVSEGGCEVLVSQLSSSVPQLVTKAANLLTNLLMYKEAKDKLIAINLPQKVVPYIIKSNESKEYLLNLLRTYIEDKAPEALNQCRVPSLGLKKVLARILTTPSIIDFMDQNREIIEYCNLIRDTVFGADGDVYDCEEEADR